MNTLTRQYSKHLIIITLLVMVTTACTTAPIRPAGADNVRSKLTQLQSDSQLASRAPLAIEEAEAAVIAAEIPRDDLSLSSHLVLMADRQIEVARALAQARLLEDQRQALVEQRDRVRLDARTREADAARRDANDARYQADLARGDTRLAQTDADIARSRASSARSEAELARIDAGRARQDANLAQNQSAADRRDALLARQRAEELQSQIDILNARNTDRGLVVTLGDVLFETGRADLKGGNVKNLNNLADFLNKYENRTVLIEGHTDNVGDENYNQGLSLRRADAVRSYLISKGVSGSRMNSFGMGETTPVSSNDSSTGRQQNRRVEVIIANEAIASR
jgi:outer membrane protein OmpA-like peptidoglycan-associated protein